MPKIRELRNDQPLKNVKVSQARVIWVDKNAKSDKKKMFKKKLEDDFNEQVEKDFVKNGNFIPCENVQEALEEIKK